MTANLARPDAPGLLRIEEVRKMLAECVRVDEVKDIHDKAAAIAAYYRERGASLEIQNEAAEVRLRAERRLGELLKGMPKNTGAAAPRGGPRARGAEVEPRADTLGEIGITKKQSSVWQRIAKVAEEEFEERVAEAKENGLELTTSRVLRGPPPEEVKPRHVAPPPPPPSRAPAPEAFDFSTPGKISILVTEALDPICKLFEEWPDDLSMRPLVMTLREKLEHIESVERANEKRRRANDAA